MSMQANRLKTGDVFYFSGLNELDKELGPSAWEIVQVQPSIEAQSTVTNQRSMRLHGDEMVIPAKL